MANPDRGEVDLIVKGITYTLRPRTNSIRELEKRMGKPYGELMRRLDDVDMEVLCQFLFALLQPHHSKLIRHVDQVGDLVDEAGGFQAIYPSLIELLIVNSPKKRPVQAETPDGAPNPPETSAADGTGENSGLTLVRLG